MNIKKSKPFLLLLFISLLYISYINIITPEFFKANGKIIRIEELSNINGGCLCGDCYLYYYCNSCTPFYGREAWDCDCGYYGVIQEYIEIYPMDELAGPNEPHNAIICDGKAAATLSLCNAKVWGADVYAKYCGCP
ncbi:MAG: hypothetical protein WCU00_01485 [Candidatus Latescibacterota bacterium]